MREFFALIMLPHVEIEFLFFAGFPFLSCKIAALVLYLIFLSWCLVYLHHRYASSFTPHVWVLCGGLILCHVNRIPYCNRCLMLYGSQVNLWRWRLEAKANCKQKSAAGTRYHSSLQGHMHEARIMYWLFLVLLRFGIDSLYWHLRRSLPTGLSTLSYIGHFSCLGPIINSMLVL